MTQDAPLDQSALAAARKRIERMIHANGFYGHKITISSPPDRNGNSPVTAMTLATEIITSYLDALSRRVPASGGELTRYAMETLTGGTIPLPVVRDYGEWVKFSDLAASPIVAAPEGWRTVPVELTPEMLRAGIHERDRPGSGAGISAIYRAIVTAAPPAPEGKAEPGEDWQGMMDKATAIRAAANARHAEEISAAETLEQRAHEIAQASGDLGHLS